MLIDLHTHSAVSDGTDTPRELVQAAAKANLSVVALTDHDTFDGLDEAQAAGTELGLQVLRGIELSCTERGASVHLLGYGLDEADPTLAQELIHVRQGRSGRVQRVLELLAELGAPITEEQVMAQVGDSPSVGRPHIADALIAAGHVRDRKEAFDRFLSDGGPAHVPRYAIDLARGIDARRGQPSRQAAGQAIPEQAARCGRGGGFIDDLRQGDGPARALARTPQDRQRHRRAVGGHQEYLRLAFAGKRAGNVERATDPGNPGRGVGGHRRGRNAAYLGLQVGRPVPLAIGGDQLELARPGRRIASEDEDPAFLELRQTTRCIGCDVEQIADPRRHPANAAQQGANIRLDIITRQAGTQAGCLGRLDLCLRPYRRVRNDGRGDHEIGKVGIARAAPGERRLASRVDRPGLGGRRRRILRGGQRRRCQDGERGGGETTDRA